MKTTYKISFGILIILFLAYLVLAQTTNTRKLETGRIVVSTEGASSANTLTLIPIDFIPLPKGKCDVVITTPLFAGNFQYNQNITVSEVKNTTVSRNSQSCNPQLITIGPNTYGKITCDAKINLDDVYYLMRITFAEATPYFTVNYQCKTL